MTSTFRGALVHTVVNGFPVPLGHAPPSSSARDTSISHGRELTLNHVGPHATPSGTVYNTQQTISTPGVYSNLIFNKGLIISASDVEIYDCYIGDDTTSHSANLRLTGSNISVHHCEIDNNEAVYYCVENTGGGSGANRNQVYRNHIHSGGQGLSSAAGRYEFDENYVDNIVAPDPAPYLGDDVWHADGVISWGEDEMYVRRNKILCSLDQTGIINIGSWVGMPAHNVTGLTCDSNYFAGAGFIFYIEERGVQTVTGFTITNNDIGQDFYSTGGFNGIWYGGAPPAVDPTTSGNRLVTALGAFVSDQNWPY